MVISHVTSNNHHREGGFSLKAKICVSIAFSLSLKVFRAEKMTVAKFVPIVTARLILDVTSGGHRLSCIEGAIITLLNLI